MAKSQVLPTIDIDSVSDALRALTPLFEVCRSLEYLEDVVTAAVSGERTAKTIESRVKALNEQSDSLTAKRDELQSTVDNLVKQIDAEGVRLRNVKNDLFNASQEITAVRQRMTTEVEASLAAAKAAAAREVAEHRSALEATLGDLQAEESGLRAQIVSARREFADLRRQAEGAFQQLRTLP